MVTSFDKALIALIMAAVAFAETTFGWTLGLTEEWVAATIALLTPIFVYLVPNRQ